MAPIFATLEDIQGLAMHHRKMFEEIWFQKGQILEADRAEEIEKAYAIKLSKEIPEGTCKAWVIKDGGHILASGAISIVNFVPVPNDPNPHVAYMHSIYTEKASRGKKLARRIVAEAINYCKESGIRRVILNTSDAGKPLYEKLGFMVSLETMRYFIK